MLAVFFSVFFGLCGCLDSSLDSAEIADFRQTTLTIIAEKSGEEVVSFDAFVGFASTECPSVEDEVNLDEWSKISSNTMSSGDCFSLAPATALSDETIERMAAAKIQYLYRSKNWVECCDDSKGGVFVSPTGAECANQDEVCQ